MCAIINKCSNEIKLLYKNSFLHSVPFSDFLSSLELHNDNNAAIWKYWRTFKTIKEIKRYGSKISSHFSTKISFNISSQSLFNVYLIKSSLRNFFLCFFFLLGGKSKKGNLLACILEAIHRVNFFKFIFYVLYVFFTSFFCLYIFIIYYLSKNKFHLFYVNFFSRIYFFVYFISFLMEIKGGKNYSL